MVSSSLLTVADRQIRPGGAIDQAVAMVSSSSWLAAAERAGRPSGRLLFERTPAGECRLKRPLALISGLQRGLSISKPPGRRRRDARFRFAPIAGAIVRHTSHQVGVENPGSWRSIGQRHRQLQGSDRAHLLRGCLGMQSRRAAGTQQTEGGGDRRQQHPHPCDRAAAGPVRLFDAPIASPTKLVTGLHSWQRPQLRGPN